MFMKIVKAKINGIEIPKKDIRYVSILEELSKQVDVLNIDESKLFQQPAFIQNLMDSAGLVKQEKQQVFPIHSWNDLSNFLFAQYAFYHHSKKRKATFTINDDNYIVLRFS